MIRLVATALASLLALLAAGCGGGGDDDARRTLRATFTSAKPVESGRVALAVKVDAVGLPGFDRGLGVDLQGPFQTRAGQAPQFDLDLGLTTGAGTLKTGAISTGDQGWLKLQGGTYTLGKDALAQLVKPSGAQGGGVDLKSLGVDPSRWLEDPETAGEAEVSGVTTKHVRGTVNVPRLLEDLGTLSAKASSLGVAQAGQVPQELTEEQRKTVEESVKEATVDVWSGKDDNRLRRLLVNVRFDVEGKEQRGTVRLDLRLAELDREQRIAAPKDPRPLSELQAGLAALAGAVQQQGGAQGGTAAAPGATTQPGAGAGAGDYQDCLAQAGGDLRAQQECAALLGG